MSQSSLGAANKRKYRDQEDNTSGDEEFARQLQMRFNAEDNNNFKSSSVSSNEQIIDIYELSLEKEKVMKYLETNYPNALKDKDCGRIIACINKCRGVNVQLVAELATEIKKKLPETIKNRVSFCFYGATWKAMIGSRETVKFLFGEKWGSHWGWWIKEAIIRQDIWNWQSIIKQMKVLGLDIKKFPSWPSKNTILFENMVVRLKVAGTNRYSVEYL